MHWSPLIALSRCRTDFNRTWDQPVDGLVVVNRTAFLFVHRGVQGISHWWQAPRLVPFAIDANELERLAAATHETQRGGSHSLTHART